MDEKEETFTYTYSAKEQEEIKQIREKYTPMNKEESPMEQLRRLDRSATKSAAIVSLIVGIISSLVMGIGIAVRWFPTGSCFLSSEL